MDSFVNELGPKLPTMEIELDIVDKVVDNLVDVAQPVLHLLENTNVSALPVQQLVSKVPHNVPVKKVSFQANTHIIPDAPEVHHELATNAESTLLSQTVKHAPHLKQSMDILNGPFRPSIMTLYFFIALVLLGLYVYYKH